MAPHAIGIEAVTDTEAILIPDPLTADTVAARRAKSGKLIAGTAAYTSSDFFKHAVSILCPPPPPLQEISAENYSSLENQKPRDLTVSHKQPHFWTLANSRRSIKSRKQEQTTLQPEISSQISQNTRTDLTWWWTTPRGKLPNPRGVRQGSSSTPLF
jgi:aromatic amino acid aminotransferase I